ncbi:MAG: hypothetical protein JXD18_12010 [Anaerolineae bacterium]|nr:hypothetical protein [Anaerolineae bacterium]
MKVQALFPALAFLLLLAGCREAVAPAAVEVVPTIPATGAITADVLICPLSDGSGVLTATQVISTTEGWSVMGSITGLVNGEVFTVTTPATIAPEACPAGIVTTADR